MKESKLILKLTCCEKCEVGKANVSAILAHTIFFFILLQTQWHYLCSCLFLRLTKPKPLSS